MLKPRVSIIIPVYNAEKTIKETLDSLLVQTYQNFEVILVDDGSSDQSVKIINRFIKNNPRQFKYFRQKNQGVAAARNTGLKQIKGDFIAFLDNDDCWLENRLEKMVNYLFKHKNIDLVDTNMYLWFPSKKLEKIYYPDMVHLPDKLSLNNLIKGNFLFSGAMFRKKVFLEVGFLDSNLDGVDDYDYWLRCKLAGFNFAVINEPLALYRQREDSLSRNTIHMDQRLLKMWLEYVDRDDLTNKQKQIIELKINKIRIALADQAGLSKQYESALDYYQKTTGRWSDLSAWFLRANLTMVWFGLLKLKLGLRKFKN